MNGYVLVTDLAQLEALRAAALPPSEPNERFAVRYSTDGAKAVVQAKWPDGWPLPAGCAWLGALLPDGSAEETVYEALSGAEWN